VGVFDIAEHLVSYEAHELLAPHEHAEREVRLWLLAIIY
jgi:hypothetical protein